MHSQSLHQYNSVVLSGMEPLFRIFFGDFSMLQKINIVILALCY